MAVPLSRVSQKIFGVNGPSGDFGVIGSKAAGAPTFSQDPTQIQSLPNYLQGLGDIIIGNYDPPLEDLNSFFFLVARQLAYIFQQGVPEYDPLINYFAGSLVMVSGVIYNSVINSNLGNSPATDNGTNWQVGIGGLSGGVPVGVSFDFTGPSTSLPTGYLLCQGQAVNRTTYARLFNVIGILYGAGDGTTTFNLPQGQGQIFMGQLPLDPNFGTVGKPGGQVTIQQTNLPNYNLTPAALYGNGSGLTGFQGTNNGANPGGTTVDLNGGGLPFLPPYQVVGGKIIKY